MKYKNESLENSSAGKSDFFQTFDSGDGVLVPDGMEGDFAHMDGKGLGSYCQNQPDLNSVHGSVPSVESKK